MNYYEELTKCPMCNKKLIYSKASGSKRCPHKISRPNVSAKLNHFAIYDDCAITRTSEIVGSYYLKENCAYFFDILKNQPIKRMDNLSFYSFIKLSSKLNNLLAFL